MACDEHRRVKGKGQEASRPAATSAQFSTLTSTLRQAKIEVKGTDGSFPVSISTWTSTTPAGAQPTLAMTLTRPQP